MGYEMTPWTGDPDAENDNLSCLESLSLLVP